MDNSQSNRLQSQKPTTLPQSLEACRSHDLYKDPLWSLETLPIKCRVSIHCGWIKEVAVMSPATVTSSTFPSDSLHPSQATPEAWSNNLEVVFFSPARITPSSAKMPTVEPAKLMASMAYSTWGGGCHSSSALLRAKSTKLNCRAFPKFYTKFILAVLAGSNLAW